MSNVITLYLLFAVPVLIFAFIWFGAWLFAKGAHGSTPSLSVPRFGASSNGKQSDRATANHLPEV